MPFISTRTTVSIDSEKRESIKTKLGKAIELIPGKTENWLMLSFQDKLPMYFKGTNKEPLAFVEVMLLGSASREAYDKLTNEITNIINEELGIKPSGIYIKYEECSHWGWNGSNF